MKIVAIFALALLLMAATTADADDSSKVRSFKMCPEFPLYHLQCGIPEQSCRKITLDAWYLPRSKFSLPFCRMF